MNINWKKIIEEIRVLVILVIIAFTVKSTLVEIYVVPTGSMKKTILPGDMLIGNKFIYGMRTPNWIGIPWTRAGFHIPSIRLPKFKQIENGDVTIFEFPRDPFQKYVKRCIGTPGDVINISSGDIMINEELMEFPKEGKKGKIHYGADRNLYSYFSGNLDNIQDFIVPHKGMIIDFNEINDWESIITLLIQDGNEIKYNGKIFTLIDPNHIARIPSVVNFIYYKVMRMFKSNREVYSIEIKEQKKYIAEMRDVYAKKKMINPWHEWDLVTQDDQHLINKMIINGKALNDAEELTDCGVDGFGDLICDTDDAWDDSYGNGIWDEGEVFVDRGNGIWDEGEVFVDRGNGIWDNGEEFTDDNKNGTWNEGEDFVDRGNGIWDSAEEFTDDNKNGIWDNGEEFTDDNKNDAWDEDEVFVDIGNEIWDPMSTYELKNNFYFFMGDNRDNSLDSRFWGFVPESQILGTPLFALVNIFELKLRLKIIS